MPNKHVPIKKKGLLPWTDSRISLLPVLTNRSKSSALRRFSVSQPPPHTFCLASCRSGSASPQPSSFCPFSSSLTALILHLAAFASRNVRLSLNGFQRSCCLSASACIYYASMPSRGRNRDEWDLTHCCFWYNKIYQYSYNFKRNYYVINLRNIPCCSKVLSHYSTSQCGAPETIFCSCRTRHGTRHISTQVGRDSDLLHSKWNFCWFYRLEPFAVENAFRKIYENDLGPSFFHLIGRSVSCCGRRFFWAHPPPRDHCFQDGRSSRQKL